MNAGRQFGARVPDVRDTVRARAGRGASESTHAFTDAGRRARAMPHAVEPALHTPWRADDDAPLPPSQAPPNGAAHPVFQSMSERTVQRSAELARAKALFLQRKTARPTRFGLHAVRMQQPPLGPQQAFGVSRVSPSLFEAKAWGYITCGLRPQSLARSFAFSQLLTRPQGGLRPDGLRRRALSAGPQVLARGCSIPRVQKHGRQQPNRTLTSTTRRTTIHPHEEGPASQPHAASLMPSCRPGFLALGPSTKASGAACRRNLLTGGAPQANHTQQA